MKNFLADLHYTLRLIVKNFWFIAMVVIILAIGIGANAAVFSAVNSVLLRPLPYADSDRLIAIAANLSNMGIHQASSSSAEYLHLRENSKTFSEISGYSSPISYNLSEVEEPERIQSMYVTENFFSVMGVPPVLGRGFGPTDSNPGLTTLAVISHGLWTRRFASDPQIVGKMVRLDSDPFTIVGVMPASFRHPTPLASLNVDVWIAAGFVAPPFDPPGRESRMMRLVGRLKPETDLEQARAEMKVLGSQLQAQYPDRYPVASGFSIDLRPLQERITGDFRPLFIILLIMVSLVLLIACSNVANLLLARANAR
ncbi:MAG TPA: ABC transporter permease, partial [Pyrinomonadaceae bacterium]|nr:ABC transporter permease [Pyrinomonadaceae bacterium]